MAYGSAAGVRLVNSKITTTVASDSAIEDTGGILEKYIDSRIDAFLGTTFEAPVPDLIAGCSDEMGAAWIVRTKLVHDDQDSGWATAVWDRCVELLKEIKAGKLTVAGFSALAPLAASDPEADEPAYRIFVNDEVDWSVPIQERATS